MLFILQVTIGIVSELGMKLIGFLLISTLFDEGLVEDGGKGGIQLKCAQEVRLL